MKKIASVILISLLLSLGLGVLAPRPTQEVCNSLDCGFDVARTDYMDIKSNGYPFTSTKAEVTREPEINTIEILTNTHSTNNVTAILLNTLFWSTLTTALFLIVRLKKKNANHRN